MWSQFARAWRRASRPFSFRKGSRGFASRAADEKTASRSGFRKGIIGRYMKALQTNPIRTKALQAGIIATLGDIIAQQLVERPEEHDWRRTAALAAFGFTWSGPFSHYWYNAAEKIVRSKGWGGVAQKTFLDQFVIGPPGALLFFTAVGTMEGQSFQEVKENISRNFWKIQLASWKVWPAINMITFSVVPVPLRPLFTGVLALCWSCYGSWTIHQKDEPAIASGAVTDQAAPQQSHRDAHTDARTLLAPVMTINSEALPHHIHHHHNSRADHGHRDHREVHLSEAANHSDSHMGRSSEDHHRYHEESDDHDGRH